MAEYLAVVGHANRRRGNDFVALFPHTSTAGASVTWELLVSRK